MALRELTEAQRKALNWLVPGQDCVKPPRSVSVALNSLILHHPDLARAEERKTPRGRRYLVYRLTPFGELMLNREGDKDK